MEKSENEENNERKGCLYVVSTHIGNWDDITLRALKVLKSSDKIICEEAKVGGRVLKQYNVKKDFELLNEQNEDEMTQEYVHQLNEGARLALISDCGTPLFADPGFQLVKAAIRKDIDVVVVPGASSIMTGLVASSFDMKQFLYAGFLSRQKEERKEQFKALSFEKRTVVLLETPYRLMPFLEGAKEVLPYRNAYIGCNLTLPFETHHRGTFLELYKKFKEKRFKGEFIVVFEGLPRDTIFEEGFMPYGSDDPKERDDRREFRGRDYRGGGRDRNNRGGGYRDRDSRGGGGRSKDRNYKGKDRNYKDKDRDRDGGGRGYKKDNRGSDNKKGGYKGKSDKPWNKSKSDRFKKRD